MKSQWVNLEPILDLVKENCPMEEIVDRLGKNEVAECFTAKEVSEYFSVEDLVGEMHGSDVLDNFDASEAVEKWGEDLLEHFTVDELKDYLKEKHGVET